MNKFSVYDHIDNSVQLRAPASVHTIVKLTKPKTRIVNTEAETEIQQFYFYEYRWRCKISKYTIFSF